MQKLFVLPTILDQLSEAEPLFVNNEPDNLFMNCDLFGSNRYIVITLEFSRVHISMAF